MADSYTTKDLEARILELEERLRVQDRKIRLLGTIATVRHFSPTDDPLEKFFNAPEFWEVIFEDNGLCHNECMRVHREVVEQCNGNVVCIEQAGIDCLSCNDNCGELSPFPPL